MLNLSLLLILIIYSVSRVVEKSFVWQGKTGENQSNKRNNIVVPYVGETKEDLFQGQHPNKFQTWNYTQKDKTPIEKLNNVSTQ